MRADGAVGAMRKATGRRPWRPAHIHFGVTADGYDAVTTHIFDRRDPYLDSDAVFAVKESLICDFTKHDTPTAEARKLGITGPVYTAEFDFALKPAGAAAQANVLDAQRRLAALGARA
jgi:catechol 1,2-dioxygenase